MLNGLRPYQLEIANAVLDSVFYRKGLTFSVEIARQGGKNEISARLERLLLVLNMGQPLQLVKCSPTFKPQTVISMTRLKDRLNDAGLNGAWTSEMGYIVRLGDARAVFLSADVSSNVVGNTAHLLLEVDESQDVIKDKYTKKFKPMGATTNCTVVHYGTTWDDSTLLEEIKQTNLELEKKDGIKRHFRYDWLDVGKYNPDYLINVEIERRRLGENHPLFLTQYRLLPLHGGGGFFNSTQKAQLQGTHSRQRSPEIRVAQISTSSVSQVPGSSMAQDSVAQTSLPVGIGSSKIYIAGIDLAGEAESDPDAFFKSLNPKQDSTVLTFAELSVVATPSEFRGNQSFLTPYSQLPPLRIVEHYSWKGKKHVDLYPQLVDLLKNVWHCKRVVVDSTGVGEPVAAFLKHALGHLVVPFKFTSQSKSELGFNLLSAINSGRLKIYAPDNSPEYRDFWLQIEKAKSFYRPSQTMNFFVDPSEGHDDFLMSMALLVEASGLYEPRTARGKELVIR
jgi:hypothetical protein